MRVHAYMRDQSPQHGTTFGRAPSLSGNLPLWQHVQAAITFAPMLAAVSPPFQGLRSPGCGMTDASSEQLRRKTKQQVCEAFLQKLREKKSIDLDAPGVVEGIRQHVQTLPTRYALDVNINSYDIINHQRLLNSARADPSAVSFQVRTVDVSLYGTSGMTNRPSFGGLDTLLSEVRAVLCPRPK